MEKEKNTDSGNQYSGQDRYINGMMPIVMSYAKKLGVEFESNDEKLYVDENIRQILKVLRNCGIMEEQDVVLDGKEIHTLVPTPKFIDATRYSYEFLLLLSAMMGNVNIFNESEFDEFVDSDHYLKIAIAYVLVVATQKPYIIETLQRTANLVVNASALSMKVDDHGRLESIAIGNAVNNLSELDRSFVKAVDLVSTYMLDWLKNVKEQIYSYLKINITIRGGEIARYMIEGNEIALLNIGRHAIEMIGINTGLISSKE